MTLIAVGKLGRGAEADLVDHYLKLIPAVHRRWRLSPIEIDDRKATQGPDRKAWDAQRIVAKRPPGTALISLDERGKALTSMELAKRLSGFEDSARAVCFAIGGPDGLDDSVRDQSDILLSFGKMTWPHRLVRVMLAEQLYRAAAIDAGHPYHREG
ncbi:MAG: 23S rRNA (pseudouridine(1915)-N(3))-methyltransferase RlmH [Pseudomonadota bacterium]